MMKKTDRPDAPVDFEAALAELEGIVKQLEGGKPGLDESLRLFERGVELARKCKERLDAAELRVAKLVKDRDDLFREEPAADEE
ncbi:MAG TPA: exodeoxyribonuclease VII small subunit [candidate division WOR-3 bacterium]|uniref:Exodeoxyribonuclease 7 small subunit n=1 Tax=candidate division WOR-3 bacterium TaxID=2052148 RepID=A0A7V0T6R6_UNCW3|nr:exodeoxyribonuclease VII small subunit [candidate division WOR-3 bacterium]